MMRSLVIAALLATSMPCAQAKMVSKGNHGEWTLFCEDGIKDRAHCAATIALKDADGDGWIKLAAMRAGISDLKLTIRVPPNLKSLGKHDTLTLLYRDPTLLYPNRSLILFLQCQPEYCQGVWRLPKPDLDALLSNTTLRIRYRTSKEEGIEFPIPLKGLMQALNDLEQKPPPQ